MRNLLPSVSVSYSLLFDKRALKEWRKLPADIRNQFKKKLAERMINPHVPASRISGRRNRYKIKLRACGYRLVYDVNDTALLLLVIVTGKREAGEVYRTAAVR